MLQYNVGHRHNLASWRKALSGMKWFRSNIKHVTKIALLALSIQFALSFGHFHGVAAQAAPALKSGQQHPASHHGSDQHPEDTCAICAVMAMASTVLFATPPLLLLPQAIELLYFTTDAEFAHLCSARVAFQPRAPPVFLTSID